MPSCYETLHTRWRIKSLQNNGLQSITMPRSASSVSFRLGVYPTRLTVERCCPEQAAATRATELELARDYDAAFQTYLAAAQTYMFLLRHTTDAEIKQRIRTVSGKLVDRAEKIKQANKLSKKPVAKNDLSIGAASPLPCPL